MPNHVTTRCVVRGSEAHTKRFRERAFVKEQDALCFDFNVFIPMPEILSGTVDGTTSEDGAILLSILQGRSPPQSRFALFAGKTLRPERLKSMRAELGMPKAPLAELAKAWLEKNPDTRLHGEHRLRAAAETGYLSWYDWSLHNWGTKWNSYNLHVATDYPLEFVFDTAWAFPIPVFDKIAADFPALSFHCACYDEGGNFAGHGYFNPGGEYQAFTICDPTDALYRRVYGRPRPAG